MQSQKYQRLPDILLQSQKNMISSIGLASATFACLIAPVKTSPADPADHSPHSTLYSHVPSYFCPTEPTNLFSPFSNEQKCSGEVYLKMQVSLKAGLSGAGGVQPLMQNAPVPPPPAALLFLVQWRSPYGNGRQTSSNSLQIEVASAHVFQTWNHFGLFVLFLIYYYFLNTYA